ncbi:MAG TPA: MBL fold metallo-hydrolase [Nitrospirales bacterium]|nr:MBL fold metallo-hydrolase [Nitrospirales bacterium]HIN33769.1 MBL fold metallo-hydrolase [Nitrospirales bacterium]
MVCLINISIEREFAMASLEDEFGDIIKKARQGQSLTLEDVIDKTGITETTLRALEGCKQPPTSNEVQAIALFLSLDSQTLETIGREQWQPLASPDWVAETVETVRGDIGGYEVKGYLIYDSTTKDAVMIDTAYNPKQMLQRIDVLELRLNGICLTHGHSDHAYGIDTVVAIHPTTVYIGQGDMSMVTEYRSSMDIQPARDGHILKIGSIDLRFMATPGHTPGGVCYSTGPLCFVGDTLFAGSIGRSCPATLYSIHLQSVKERILRMDESVVLLPGHGPATTVGEEKRHNPFVTGQALPS